MKPKYQGNERVQRSHLHAFRKEFEKLLRTLIDGFNYIVVPIEEEKHIDRLSVDEL